jgi:hypothetical protein
MYELIIKYCFPVTLISFWGVYFYLKNKEKRKFPNEITGGLNSKTPVVLINPKFVDAATRMIEKEEEPTDEFVENVIENIKIVLAIHFGIVYAQTDYDDPWVVLKINHGNFECLIRKSDFILRKGDKKCVSQLNIDAITLALRSIGVLK